MNHSLRSQAWSAFSLLGLIVSLSCCAKQPEFTDSSASNCSTGATEGVVYRVLDGDTFKLRKSDKTDVTIRLEQIDAPEKRQPWSNRSKQMLTTLLGDNHLCILGTKQDRYGRLLGEVHVGNLNVNS